MKYVKQPRICPVCKDEVNDIYFMLALETPYMNLFFHKGCYSENKGDLIPIIEEYLQLYTKNQQKCYNSIRNKESNRRDNAEQTGTTRQEQTEESNTIQE